MVPRWRSGLERIGPARCRRLSAWVEAVVAVGQSLEAPSWFVGPMVVVAAEEDGVREVGPAAGVPWVEVVGLAPGAGDVAALAAAGAVADEEGLAFGRCVEAAGAAEVEGEAVAAEDDGEDLRGARQPPAWAAVIWSPVRSSPGTRAVPMRSAVARSALSASKSMVTTRVVASPPWIGSRVEVEGLDAIVRLPVRSRTQPPEEPMPPARNGLRRRRSPSPPVGAGANDRVCR